MQSLKFDGPSFGRKQHLVAGRNPRRLGEPTSERFERASVGIGAFEALAGVGDEDLQRHAGRYQIGSAANVSSGMDGRRGDATRVGMSASAGNGEERRRMQRRGRENADG